MIWRGKFRGGSGSWGAQVGGEVTEGEIRFVTDARDDGHMRIGNRTHDAFIVECPQVFDGTAAAGDDDDIE